MFIFNLFIVNVIAQDSTQSKQEKMPHIYNWAIKFSALSLVDLFNPHFQIGVEKMLNRRFSIQQDVAFGFIPSSYQFKNYQSYKFSTEGRYYFWYINKTKNYAHRIQQRQSRYFVSLENLMVFRRFDANDYFYNDQLQKEEVRSVPISKKIWAVNINFGIQIGLMRKIKSEFYLGLGSRRVVEKHKSGDGVINDESTIKGFNLYTYAKYQGVVSDIQPAIGFKLNYVIN